MNSTRGTKRTSVKGDGSQKEGQFSENKRFPNRNLDICTYGIDIQLIYEIL